jgi:branched-chain amino acid transport system substrate-binding protein
VHSLNMRALSAGLSSLLLATSPVWAFQDDGTVRIGSIESQTGISAPYGIQSRNGSRIAVDEINAKGGITVAGKQVKLQITPDPNGYDPGDDPVQHLAIFKKLVFEDQVLVVKGITRSTPTEMVFNYLNELDKQNAATVVLSTQSSTPGLGGITRWGFRNAFFETGQLDRQFALLKDKFGYKTAAVFVVRDNPYNSTIVDTVILPLLKQRGFEVTGVVEGFEKKPSDFSREIGELKQANADFVVISSTVVPGVNLMKEAGRRGLKPKMWVGTVAQLQPEVPELGGKAVERMIVGNAFSPATPSIQALQAEYRKRFGSDIALFGVNGYDAMYLFKAAIEKAAIANLPGTLQEDRAKFRDALASTSITGAAGTKVSFGANGDATTEGVILTIKDGKFVDWDGKPFD